MEYIAVGNIDEFNSQRILSVMIFGKKVGIIKKSNSEFYAIEVGCKHQGADITKGTVLGDVATCPRHGWKYNLLTGECLNHNTNKLRRYGLRIENKVIYVTSSPLLEMQDEDDPLLHFFD